jgi:hypothetical protein
MHFRAWLAVTGCILVIGCGSVSPSSTAPSPGAATTRDPGNENCPDGKAAQSGLASFGAFIGKWQSIHTQDPHATADYTISSVPGHIAIRCSTDNYVIVEQIFLSAPMPATQALSIGLNELPKDAKNVYDHPHDGCRTLQYQSQQLAQQLGLDDNDGRVGIELEGDATKPYDPASVTLILIDFLDALGEDTHGC